MTNRPKHRGMLLAVISFLVALSIRRIMKGTQYLVVSSDISFLMGENGLLVLPESTSLTYNSTNVQRRTEQDGTNNLGGDNISPIQVSPFVSWKEKWGTNHSPCVVDPPNVGDPFRMYTQRKPSKKGILFIKIEKAASSTFVGVAARIAHVLGRDPDSAAAWKNINSSGATSKNSTGICRARLSHLWSERTKKLSLRTRHKSFLFTFLRNPSKRALSQFYFFSVHRSKNQTVPPDDVVIDSLKAFRNAQLMKITDKASRPMIQKSYLHTNNTAYKQELAKQIEGSLSNMDFVGLVERMDESLVVLQLLLDLKTSDVLFGASSKLSGSWEYNSRKKSCKYIPKQTPSPAVQSFVKSQEWAQLNYGDELLYQVVNARLDATIEAIGRAKFESALEEFHNAKSMIEKHCPPPIRACDANGTVVPRKNRDRCYLGDAGCGYECIDKLFHGKNSGNQQ